MVIVEQRRTYQTTFLNSGQNIEVGHQRNLPIPLHELVKIDATSPYVEQVFDKGLTAIVYKLKVNGQYFTLKKKRDEILVRNVDGQTSFLNEVQRRRDFERLKQAEPERFLGVADTVYANLHQGVILSKWIEGELITDFTKEVFESLFSTLLEIEKEGLFECDLSLSNLLLDASGRVNLFDFGYMYPYDPRIHFNSDGKEIPIFHMCERVESRCFMQYLMNLEQKEGLGKALASFKIAKEVALRFYQKKMEWLIANHADPDVLAWQNRFIELWENGLRTDAGILNIYEMESFRSYVLDVHDDISGKSCTVATLQKADKILQKIDTNFSFLKENNGLFWGDESLTKNQLLKKYAQWKEKALAYQLG